MNFMPSFMPSMPSWNNNTRLSGLNDEQLKALAATTGVNYQLLKTQQRAEIASAGSVGNFEEAVVPTVEIQLVTNAKNPKKARKKNPDDFRIHYELGNVLLIKNELEASISSLNTAKKINPNDEQLKRMLGDAHYRFANSLLLENDINRAISSYKSALSSNPNQLSAANRLAITLATTNDTKYQKPKEALAVAARLCQITKNQNPDFLDTLSIAYAANNNYQSAKQTSLKAIELWKKNNNEKRINAALNRIKGFESQISKKQQK